MGSRGLVQHRRGHQADLLGGAGRQQQGAASFGAPADPQPGGHRDQPRPADPPAAAAAG